MNLHRTLSVCTLFCAVGALVAQSQPFSLRHAQAQQSATSPPETWWSLVFRNEDVAEGELATVSAFAPAALTGTSIPVSQVPVPTSAVPANGSWWHFTPSTPDQKVFDVYVASWPESTSPLPQSAPLPVRLKVFVDFTSRSVISNWQLERIQVPHVTITSGPNSSDDFAVTPAFRLGPTRTDSYGTWPYWDKIVRDPFGRSDDFRYRNAHLGDWYLSFWGIYNTASGTENGLLFVWDDHGIGTTVASAFAPAEMSVERTAAGDLEFWMAERMRTDRYPSLSPPWTLADSYQSGSVLIEDAPGQDEYGMIGRYRDLVASSPALLARNASPIPQFYGQVPLAFAPRGPWTRFGGTVVEADLSGAYQDLIKQKLQPGPFGDYYVNGQSPGLYFQSDGLMEWEGPVPLPSPLVYGPSDYATIKPGYAALTSWAKSLGGLAMGYAIPSFPNASWPLFNSADLLLDTLGQRSPLLNRPPFYAAGCFDAVGIANIYTQYVRDGALAPSVGLNGLHLDGITPSLRCADVNHSHGTNHPTVRADQLHGLRSRLAAVRSAHPHVVLDEEVPTEALLDLFDSADGESFKDPMSPPMFRMTYGNVIRYPEVLFTFGTRVDWGEHWLFDLHTLRSLTDGGLPVIFFFDSGHDPILASGPNPVKDVIQSYLRGYGHLAPAFGGTLLPMPAINAPSCEVHHRHTQVRRRIDLTDPIVHGSAFRYVKNSKPHGAIVLLDWGTTQDLGELDFSVSVSQLAELSVGLRSFSRAGSNPLFRTASAYDAPNETAANAFAVDHLVDVTIDLAAMGLPTAPEYLVRLTHLQPAQQQVKSTWGETTYKLGGANNPSVRTYQFYTKPSSLYLVEVEPKP